MIYHARYSIPYETIGIVLGLKTLRSRRLCSRRPGNSMGSKRLISVCDLTCLSRSWSWESKLIRDEHTSCRVLQQRRQSTYHVAGAWIYARRGQEGDCGLWAGVLEERQCRDHMSQGGSADCVDVGGSHGRSLWSAESVLNWSELNCSSSMQWNAMRWGRQWMLNAESTRLGTLLIDC